MGVRRQGGRETWSGTYKQRTGGRKHCGKAGSGQCTVRRAGVRPSLRDPRYCMDDTFNG
jgi:hypothetical protein